jgi:hypothetical protein
MYVKIRLNDHGHPQDQKCSCAAGQALCHHAVALLYQLQHYQKLGLKVVPPVVSKTSVPQVGTFLSYLLLYFFDSFEY